MLIRDALRSEMAEVGDIRVTAYVAGSHLRPNSSYEPRLRSLGADGAGDVLVAVNAGTVNAGTVNAGTVNAGAAPADRPVPPGSAILGTVMLLPWPHAGPVVAGPDEAEIRALAVAPGAQRGGIGVALLYAIIERARVREVRHLVLQTQPDMQAAQRMYEQAGFIRLPERDFSPTPGAPLLAYGMRLDQP